MKATSAELLLTLSFLVSGTTVAGIESIKLYDTPNFHPDPMCDQYREMELDTSDVVGPRMVAMKNRLSSTSLCDLGVEPDLVNYLVDRRVDGCGTLIYHTISDDGRVLVIEDNRGGTCESVAAAAIVVKEGDLNGIKYLYTINPK